MYKNLNKLQLYILTISIFSILNTVYAQEKLKFSAQNLETINTDILTDIFAKIEQNNMDMILLESLPNIAVLSEN